MTDDFSRNASASFVLFFTTCALGYGALSLMRTTILLAPAAVTARSLIELNPLR
jgi:hypothetical protein